MRPDLIVRSWLRTRRLMGASAERLARSREAQWLRLQPALARTPALAPHLGRPLASYPVTEPQQIRSDYGAWNSLSLDASALTELADRAEAGATGGQLSAGWSTGSGTATRGLFVASAAERADYIGQSLARLLPAGELFRRQRLALHLRASNSLYSDVRGKRIAFAHFPLEPAPAETMARLAEYDPTILIAPPHRLLGFARAGLRLPSLRHLFCGSEPLSGEERRAIAAAFGTAPRVIYQATEGFLAAECRHGRLHLNEHAIQFEFEPVPDTQGFRLIVSDLRRVSQPIIRVRMDDFVERGEDGCSCGYSGRIINPPQGRVSDIWRFAECTVTPPQVVDAVEAILGAQHDWQATARPGSVTLETSPDVPVPARRSALDALSRLTGIAAVHSAALPPLSGPKRRKVVWQDG